MYAALNAICAHETPDIIKHQQAEIAKLRAELADVQKAHDRLEMAATCMAHRIAISTSRGLMAQDIDEEDLDEYLRSALEFYDGDIEENLQVAHGDETTRTYMAAGNIEAVDELNDEDEEDESD